MVLRLGINTMHIIQGVPVLLVGNKADVKATMPPGRLAQQEDIAKKIMREFQEVEVWVDCSAKTMMNTNDLLFYAQKSAVCPLRAIFDSSKGQLTDPCKQALERIFRLCDKDVDDVLNDAELNAFQEVCYGGSLQPHELESVKNMVRGRCPQGVTSEGLNLLGFQFLQTIFIHDSKPEMPWAVLRKFGYGLDLQLTEEYLTPVVNVAPEQSAELSISGTQFFTTLFHRYDKDHDSALSSSELDNLFATTPGIPWGKSFTENTITDFNGNVTLRGFLALWNMTTQLDYAITLRYLSYLGCEATKEAVRFTYKSASGAKANADPTISTVLMCYVFGASSVGKTSLLKSFVEKPFYDIHIPTDDSYSVANVVHVPTRASRGGGANPSDPIHEKYLVV
jgi:Ras family protein T1